MPEENDGIEEAVELLKKELSEEDVESIEIRAQEMPGDRQKGVILIWCNTYATKRAIYEKYGEGENFHPALFRGWEVRARKYPPYVKKKDRKTDDNLQSEGENQSEPQKT